MSRASPDYEKAHTRLDKAEQNAMKEAKDEHINRTWQEALADILATIVVTKLEDYVEEHTYNPGPFIRTNPFSGGYDYGASHGLKAPLNPSVLNDLR